MAITDHEVLSAMREAAADHSRADHALALRALGRQHFRTIYEMHCRRLGPARFVLYSRGREFDNAVLGNGDCHYG